MGLRGKLGPNKTNNQKKKWGVHASFHMGLGFLWGNRPNVLEIEFVRVFSCCLRIGLQSYRGAASIFLRFFVLFLALEPRF